MKINGSLHQVIENSAYSNVIHASCSGLTKLSTVASIPDWRTVYRGFGGMHMPSELAYEDANGAKGVCERGFLSTTTDMEVATSYVGKKEMPTIFSIECGAVDKGACISWLSQYPRMMRCRCRRAPIWRSWVSRWCGLQWTMSNSWRFRSVFPATSTCQLLKISVPVERHSSAACSTITCRDLLRLERPTK